MGRPRSFDTDAVVGRARDAFVRSGYHGTSVDDLLRATGIQRASLYQAFASKRGLFLAALDRRTGDTDDLDLLLVALMDLAGQDAEVRRRTSQALEALGESGPERLGRRLILRGTPESADPELEQG